MWIMYSSKNPFHYNILTRKVSYKEAIDTGITYRVCLFKQLVTVYCLVIKSVHI